MTGQGYPPMTERRLLGLVVAACKTMGLYCYHTHDSRRSTAGFPDLVVVGVGGVLFRELKTRTGALRPEQNEVLYLLRKAGADADVWRPVDWVGGRITWELGKLRRAVVAPAR